MTPRKRTYTDAEVWADPRSPAILKSVNASRKDFGLWLLTYGEPRSAATVRVMLERDDADIRKRARKS